MSNYVEFKDISKAYPGVQALKDVGFTLKWTESWARVTYHRARSKLKEEDQ